jgi:hypothetical protein
MLQYLEQQSERPVIVEVGAGYGGLAYQLKRCVQRPCAYVIVDIPEILFWSAVFLRVNDPDKSFYIYRPGNDNSEDLQEACAKYDYLFIPNYRSQAISNLKHIDLMLNLLSFQEMSDAQVDHYASFGAKYLYSENMTRHWINKELVRPVQEILANKYSLIPPVKSYQWLLSNANQPNSVLIWALFPFFGVSKRHECGLSRVSDVIWTQFGRMNLRRNKLMFSDVIRRAARHVPITLCKRIFGA